MKEFFFYVYRIHFPTSGKNYIGRTNNFVKRFWQHLGSNSLIGKALRKHDDWQISILHTLKTQDEVNRIEMQEIQNFNSIVPAGYNLTGNGDNELASKRKEEAELRTRLESILRKT